MSEIGLQSDGKGLREGGGPGHRKTIVTSGVKLTSQGHQEAGRGQQGQGGRPAHKHISKTCGKDSQGAARETKLTQQHTQAASARPLSRLCWKPALPTCMSAAVAAKSQQEDAHGPYVGNPGAPGSSDEED